MGTLASHRNFGSSHLDLHAGFTAADTQRLDSWRYTAWVRFNYSTVAPDWSQVYGRELYDHGASPVPTSWDMEHSNVVEAPQHEALVAELHSRLVKCAARPDLC
jgi:hypothetical protein